MEQSGHLENSIRFVPLPSAARAARLPEIRGESLTGYEPRLAVVLSRLELLSLSRVSLCLLAAVLVLLVLSQPKFVTTDTINTIPKIKSTATTTRAPQVGNGVRKPLVRNVIIKYPLVTFPPLVRV